MLCTVCSIVLLFSIFHDSSRLLDNRLFALPSRLRIVFYFIPLVSLSVQDIPIEKLPSATGIFHFVRAMVGAIGTSLFTTLWERGTSFHHLNVGSAVTPFNPSTSEAFNALGQYGITGDKALEVLNKQLDIQSAMLAINDCFWVMAWIFLGLIIFLPFGRQKKHPLPER